MQQRPKMCRIVHAACFPRIPPLADNMTTKINKGIPYKMCGPNPAKFSNCSLRQLYDSGFLPKSSLVLLFCSYNMARCRQAPYNMASAMGLETLQISTCQQNGWDLENDFVQNDLRNPAYLSLGPAISSYSSRKCQGDEQKDERIERQMERQADEQMNRQ